MKRYFRKHRKLFALLVLLIAFIFATFLMYNDTDPIDDAIAYQETTTTQDSVN
ncbi:MAG: hypothetical protein LBM71_03000 [Elusimicrobiota bacterium]|jgi:hypothetical protein|nr:hypothetical protein [Elusimicrobiota bacterium]